MPYPDSNLGLLDAHPGKPDGSATGAQDAISPSCSVDGCTEGVYRRVQLRHLCRFHYFRKVKGRDLDAPKQVKRGRGAGLTPSADGTCGVPGCGKPIQSLGMCWAHYARERRYGLQHDDIAAALKAQGGCGICGRATPGSGFWVVDHDHATGRVRGILCTRCNTGLGSLGDSVEGLTAALEYLKRTA